MIADLKPFPTYRQAEGGWLGEVPSHWTIRRMKYVVREIDARSTTGKEQLLRISQYTGVTQRRRADGLDEPDTRADSLVGYKRVEPNDLVINIMLAWNGSMGVSRYEGIASPAYCVYRFGRNLRPWYFHNLLRSPAYKARIKASSTGVVESRLRLYSDDLGRIEAMVPPPDEQAAIVRFLDWANGRLERAIRAKRKVIALLNEQKQAIIHRAVTRGLDPFVPLKPSGIPWLGDIPQHWEVRRLKSLLARITDGPHTTPVFQEAGIPFISVDGIQDGELIFERCRYVTPEDHAEFTKKTQPMRDDILLGKAASTGKIARVKVAFPFSIWSPLALIRPCQTEVLSSYLEYLLKDIGAQVQIEWLCTHNTQRNISMDDIPKIVLVVPPLAEQRALVNCLDERLSGIAAAIQRLRRETELIAEYRTRIVADVITGKLDVREVAARLPDEAPLDTSEADAELGDEAETADEEAAV